MKKDQFVLHGDYIPTKKSCIEFAIDDMHVIGGSALPQKENLNYVRFKLPHSLVYIVHGMTEFQTFNGILPISICFDGIQVKCCD